MNSLISHIAHPTSKFMNPLVLDIETKNTFFDVGRDNLHKLEVSLVGLYSYKDDKYFSFGEHNLKEAGKMLKDSSLLVGFSISRFDIPVLDRHFDFDLFAIPRIDLLDEIELKLGRRVSLNVLAKTNIGLEKTHSSLEAPILYKDGKMDELRDYCLNDVKITKDLYELAKKQGYLLVPNKLTGEQEKVELDFTAAGLTL